MNFYSYKEKNKAGRSKGKLIFRTRGSKKKIIKHIVDFKRNSIYLLGIIVGVFFSHSLNKYISILRYSSGSFSLIKHIESILPGDYTYIKGYNYHITQKLLGCRLYLKFINIRQLFCDIEFFNSNKITYTKAKGSKSYIIYIKNDSFLYAVKLPTNKIIFLNNRSIATVGRISGKLNKLTVVGSAGRNHNYGYKSIVRGVAQNPVDHPHGGRTKTNKPEVSPWGWITKYSH